MVNFHVKPLICAMSAKLSAGWNCRGCSLLDRAALIIAVSRDAHERLAREQLNFAFAIRDPGANPMEMGAASLDALDIGSCTGASSKRGLKFLMLA
jgi:hypothetical protein